MNWKQFIAWYMMQGGYDTQPNVILWYRFDNCIEIIFDQIWSAMWEFWCNRLVCLHVGYLVHDPDRVVTLKLKSLFVFTALQNMYESLLPDRWVLYNRQSCSCLYVLGGSLAPVRSILQLYWNLETSTIKIQWNSISACWQYIIHLKRVTSNQYKLKRFAVLLL